MKQDPPRTKLLMAQGLAVLAYFFCVHGAHAAPAAQPAAVHAAVAATQPRPE
jgi:hypothetical protein